MVEYRLAKARVAGSNPVSRFFVLREFDRTSLFLCLKKVLRGSLNIKNALVCEDAQFAERDLLFTARLRAENLASEFLSLFVLGMSKRYEND